MNDDELRRRLAALDPTADQAVAPLTAQQKETAMTSRNPETRALLGMTAACLAVVGGGITAALVFQGSPAEKPSTTPAIGKKTVLELKKSPPNVSAICVPVSAELLSQAAHAFEGTVSSVEGGTISFTVTHWYKGGDQQVVTLTADDPSTVEDGIAFDEGKTYLVAASDTEVGGCSGSGEETADLKALFEQAF